MLILDPVLFADSGGINIPALSGYFDYSDSILAEIEKFKPGLICFSCGSDDFRWALGIADKIKKIFPIPIIFGGAHATSVPDKVLGHRSIDFVCIGEGEKALSELAGRLEKGSSDFHINNICFKENGKLVLNQPGPLEEDLDSLPFPDKEIYYKKLRFIFPGYAIITARGCPNSCTYCVNNVLRKVYKDKEKYLRRRSVSNVIEELKNAKHKYRPKFIHFCDEVFTYDRSWLRTFKFPYLREIGLPFACYVSPSSIDAELVALLKDSGCYKVQMGVQTLNTARRKELLGRDYSNEKISWAVMAFKEAGIYLTCDNIFGLPGQDENELSDMARFYLDHKPDHIEVFWLKYYPRTDIMNIAIDKGLLDKAGEERIVGGISSKGIARGGDTYNYLFARFQLLLNILHFLPRAISNYILQKKIYRIFPVLPPVFITVISRIFNRAKFDLYTSMTFRRYIYFIWLKLASPER
jgi:radical SAM superfamily enzyme YgiQ (UPF0313 family)